MILIKPDNLIGWVKGEGKYTFSCQLNQRAVVVVVVPSLAKETRVLNCHIIKYLLMLVLLI